MKIFGTCKHCSGVMVILDILAEGYDLICARCGDRTVVDYRTTKAWPCFQ